MFAFKSSIIQYHTAPEGRNVDKGLYRYIDYHISNTWTGDALEYGQNALMDMADYDYTTIAFENARNADNTRDDQAQGRYWRGDVSPAMSDQYDEYERIYGVPIGIGSYTFRQMQRGAGYPDRDFDCVYLYNLAGNGRGGGTSVLNYVIKFAKQWNLPLALHSLFKSTSFYDRIGFERIAKGDKGYFMVYGG